MNDNDWSKKMPSFVFHVPFDKLTEKEARRLKVETGCYISINFYPTNENIVNP